MRGDQLSRQWRTLQELKHSVRQSLQQALEQYRGVGEEGLPEQVVFNRTTNFASS